ncbi:MAG: methyltransferase domain-containing protein [Candidatus Omnitrophica bacterium]|nr:methyltransferase domain-containing protein [Candidatus Omnitrophota bacterium]MDD5652675.1 methyltransferase domain-containing protein [Candidatus Omnitrophota bacterium]
MKNRDYLSVVYDKKRTPVSDYPQQLAGYLSKRFNLKKGMQFLEIGSGRGDFVKEFQHYGMVCSAVDRQAGLNYPGVKFFPCDILKDRLPFGDSTFDVVFHKSLVEHLYEPDNLMKETYRVLKNSGKLIILTPDWESQMKVFYEDFTHSRPYTVLAMSDLLKVYNFRAVTAEKFYQLPPFWRHRFLLIFAKVLQLFFPVKAARWLTEKTGWKFFRFSVELMILGYGEKNSAD